MIRSVTRGILGPVQRGAASFLTYFTNAEKQLNNIQKEEEEEKESSSVSEPEESNERHPEVCMLEATLYPDTIDVSL